MATTTPNFGWAVPTSSDLVKNGATAIETLGDAIDASLVDLKGGTTGQVLTKASGTDMDFSWAAASSAATSLGYSAGKNKIINGDFYINQRGFTSTTSNGYNFDRWEHQWGGTGTVTFSAQTFTVGAAPVTGYEGKNYIRCVTTGQSGAGVYTLLVQKMEDVRTYANQTVTISFWAKAASGTPKIAVELTQSFGSGGSPSAAVNTYVGQSTLSTSWARYTQTIAVPSISGKTIGTDTNSSALNLNLWTSSGSTYDSRNGSLGIQTNTFDIWGVQVEAGSTATDFQTATGTIQGELAACQRYYCKSYNQGTNPATATATGSVGMAAVATGANANIIPARFPVEMRTTPTVTIYSPNTGTTGKISNISAASDVNATDLGTGSAGFGFYVTGAPGGAVGYWLAGHYQAVAEL